MKVRGRESTTLGFVSVSWGLVTLKFLFSGATLPLLGVQSVISLSEYSTAVALILGIWLGREWAEKKYVRS